MKAVIKVSVEGRPDLPTFKLVPPLPAQTVMDAVANELEVEAGSLKADGCPFSGATSVPAGEYVFKPGRAQPEGNFHT